MELLFLATQSLDWMDPKYFLFKREKERGYIGSIQERGQQNHPHNTPFRIVLLIVLQQIKSLALDSVCKVFVRDECLG